MVVEGSWYHVEKEVGNSRCHRLHILALFDSDRNQAKIVLMGWQLSRLLEGASMLSDM
jgi:hypothetical protein